MPRKKPFLRNAARTTVVNENDLVTLEECYSKLGQGFSRSSILRRINSGEYQEGVHWVNVASVNVKNRIIKINMAAIRELISTPAAFR
ncbi:hypothetical protein BZZ01_05120 [Nostocales cyanobacterium HT-58-2]|nr:hypothetical protein BZZ01_05120 [Nostocales cyanobacterium HT-58-2]